jgi:hypothetical protein
VIVEPLQVSFREHTLVPKPFLIVALIAVTRRILVVTAEFAELAEAGGRLPARHAGARAPHDHGAGFVVALVLLRKRSVQAMPIELNGWVGVTGRAGQTGVSATWCRGADPTDAGRWGVDPAWTVGSIGRGAPDAAPPP